MSMYWFVMNKMPILNFVIYAIFDNMNDLSKALWYAPWFHQLTKFEKRDWFQHVALLDNYKVMQNVFTSSCLKASNGISTNSMKPHLNLTIFVHESSVFHW